MKKISIADDVYEQIEKNLEKFGFKTVEEYVDFVLREALRESSGEEAFSQETFSPEEEEIIKKRLRDLGYID